MLTFSNSLVYCPQSGLAADGRLQRLCVLLANDCYYDIIDDVTSGRFAAVSAELTLLPMK